MEFLEYIKAFFYGIVEGITEWLPISSTGHLILLKSFPLTRLNVSDPFWEMFQVVIQFGAIIAVVLIFWSQIWPFGYDKYYKKNYIKNDIFSMWFKILVACVPAAVVGLLIDDVIDKYLYNWETVSIMLIVVGIGFIVIEYYNADKKPKITTIKDITYNTAFIIGCFQLIAAVFPGTSRSGATILGALLIGVSRTAAAEFTFFLAIPVMLGASLFKIAKFGFNFSSTEAIILGIGFITAFIVSMFVIKFLMAFIKKHDFKSFAWYRIILGIIVIAYFTISGVTVA